MRYGDPIATLTNAVIRALATDLPDQHRKWRDKEWTERPNEGDLVAVELWQQSFANTALMFDGGPTVAGQAISTADVAVVSDGNVAAVYCAGRLAYLAAWTREFQELCSARNLPTQRDAAGKTWRVSTRGTHHRR